MIIWQFGSKAMLLMMLILASQGIYAASGENLSENTTLDSANTTSTPGVQPADVAGIWNVSLAGSGITMALNRSGDHILGRCKFEGAQPWNGVIAGSLSGDGVNIAIAAFQGNVLICTDITGTISKDLLLGRSVSYDSDGNKAMGNVTGTRISPDVAGYAPAKIETTAEPASKSTPAVVQPAGPVQLAGSNATQDNQASNSRFKDVTQMARGINANILPWSFHL